MVQFYTKNHKRHFGLVGDGPYAAVVTQVFPTGAVELKVFAPAHGLDYIVRDVFEKSPVPGDKADQWYDPGPYPRSPTSTPLR